MSIRNILALSAALVLGTLCVSAQSYTFSATKGKLAAPNDWRSYASSPTYGIDMTVAWPAIHEDGHRQPWEWGFKANAARIPNSVAGDRLGLSLFTTNLIYDDNVARLTMQIGGGLGFYTNPYKWDNDPKNVFIGSCINSVLDIGPVLEIRAGKAGSLVIGGKFVHNSNGYLCKPNQGFNFFQGELGWRINEEPERKPASISSKYDARTAPYILIAGGISIPRDDRARNKDFMPGYTVQLGWRYAYQPCRSIAAGVDITYNFAENYGRIIDGEELPAPYIIGLALTNESHWGPVSLRLGLGIYPGDEKFGEMLYERVGVFYNFYGRRHSAFGVAIKANTVHADFIEWTYDIDIF